MCSVCVLDSIIDGAAGLDHGDIEQSPPTRIVAGSHVVIVVSVSWVVFVLLLCCINDGNGAATAH